MGTCSGLVVFITGASSGIGAALAREYARQGADLVLTARREERLMTVEKVVSDLGARSISIVCDVTREGDLVAAVNRARHEYGRIDHVVANAGFGVAGVLARLTVEDYRRQMETNLFGVLQTVYATVEDLRASRGCLAIIGSVAGFIGLPGSSPYSMSKAAVHALAGSLFHELGPQGVGVVLVAPGFVESEIRQVDNLGNHHAGTPDPIPRWLCMTADKAARKIVRAICRRRREVVVTVHGKLIAGLQRHVPGLLAKLVRFFGVRSRREPTES